MAAAVGDSVDTGEVYKSARHFILFDKYGNSIHTICSGREYKDREITSLCLVNVPSHDLNKFVTSYKNIERLQIDKMEGDLIEEIAKISNLRRLYISSPISETSLKFILKAC